MKTTRIASEFSFEVWINDSDDYNNDGLGNFDDNWLVSAGDIFGEMTPDDDTDYEVKAA